MRDDLGIMIILIVSSHEIAKSLCRGTDHYEQQHELIDQI